MLVPMLLFPKSMSHHNKNTYGNTLFILFYTLHIFTTGIDKHVLDLVKHKL